MEEKWSKVFESGKPVRAEIMREMLEQNNIPAVIVNKKDSQFPMWGKCEVHVLSRDVEKAQNLINNEGPFTETE